MRARYSAYVLGLGAFVLASWHPETRPDSITFDPGTEWLGLTVIDRVGGGALDAEGFVEFTAKFRRGDQFLELHERSRFLRVDGAWRYHSGD